MKTILITTSSFAADAGTRILVKDLEKSGLKIVLNPFGRKLTREEAGKLLAETDPVGMIAGVENLSGAVLKNGASLKVISRCGIDVANVDASFAAKIGIRVFSTPEAPTAAVAELTVGLMIDLIRKISQTDRSIRRGEWPRSMGRLLGEMTVGIIGCGRIGMKVASYLGVFGCRMLGFDVSEKKSSAVKMVGMDELLKGSDIVTFHVPMTKDNAGMVDDKFIAKMKDKSYIVNTARGGIINEASLVKGLSDGKIAGAALDTFLTEPYTGALTGFENVIMTSHIGSYAMEARTRMENESIDNLIKGLKEAGIL